MNPITVTIDGPAGVGKSAVAKSLAAHLGVPYLNSGALYRAVAWTVSRQGTNPNDDDEVLALCRQTEFVLDDQGVVVDGTRLTQELRMPHVTLIASKISQLPGVREFLRPLQRQFSAPTGVVAEGRDMGTHVFADAEIKIFLDASPNVRAQRRFRELQDCDAAVSWETTVTELTERDSRDTTRDTAPLRASLDATIIDTTELSASQVVDTILELIKQRRVRPQISPMASGDAMKRTTAFY